MTERNTPDDCVASPIGARPRMTKEEINAHPMKSYEGPIHVIRRPEQIERAVKQLEKETVLGFDTETRPTFRVGEYYPPAILQLVGEKAAYIFQLRHCRLSPALLGLLANPRIVKAGVALDRDVQELNKLAAFSPAGFVDVAKLVKRAGYMNHGLRGLATVLLGFRISKRAQTSNWDRATLTRAQIEYAATDAWVGRELYRKLQELLPEMTADEPATNDREPGPNPQMGEVEKPKPRNPKRARRTKAPNSTRPARRRRDAKRKRTPPGP